MSLHKSLYQISALSGGLSVICTLGMASAQQERSSAIRAQNNTLPTIDGKSAYTAIRWSGSGIRESKLFPTNGPVLLGRITVKEKREELIEDTLLPANIDPKKDENSKTKRAVEKTVINMGFPEQACFENTEGSFVVNSLNKARWQNSNTKMERLNPEAAALQLKKLGVKPRLDAEEYTITKEWFLGGESHEVFIFGDAKKKGLFYEINPDIITTLNPRALAEQSKEHVIFFKNCAGVSAIGAATFGAVGCAIQASPKNPVAALALGATVLCLGTYIFQSKKL